MSIHAGAAETFGSVAEQWFATKQHRKPKTVAGYRSLLDTVVLPTWADISLKRIDYESYSTWLGGLSAWTGPSEEQACRQAGLLRRTSWSALSSSMRNAPADRQERGPRNQAGRGSPRTGRARASLPNPCRTVEARPGHGRFETLTLVLGYCGLRLGKHVRCGASTWGRELTIRASATHVTRKGIVESTTKTKRARHVPVPGPVWDRLKLSYPQTQRIGVPSARGGLLPIEEYRRAFDKACDEVGIEGLVPHGLRHTTASLAISAGANVKVVQRLLGHATAAMTLDLYGHLLDDDLAAVADALGKAIEALRYHCGIWSRMLTRSRA